MGGVLGLEEPESTRDQTPFRFLKRINDRRYGDVRLMTTESTKDVYVGKEQIEDQKEQLGEYIRQAKKRMGLNHPSIQAMRGYLKVADRHACGDLFKIVYIFDYYEEDLGTEIRARASQNKPFTEDEMWYMIRTIVEALHFLQKANVSHEDITPDAILVRKEEGKMRVVVSDPLLRFNGLIQYQQICLGASASAKMNYMSPNLFEGVKEMEQGAFISHHDVFKSDVFSLGMVFLEAATLSSTADCYNYSECKINENGIQNRLQSVVDNYSTSLAKFIMSMLMFKESERPDFIALHEELLDKAQEARLPLRRKPVEDIKHIKQVSFVLDEKVNEAFNQDKETESRRGEQSDLPTMSLVFLEKPLPDKQCPQVAAKGTVTFKQSFNSKVKQLGSPGFSNADTSIHSPESIRLSTGRLPTPRDEISSPEDSLSILQIDIQSRLRKLNAKVEEALQKSRKAAKDLNIPNQ
eukprot:TRINITY_DN6228_c0_g1_i1.p1 TRINITY_DN6228_c0_g1~~TRINITY_DN6228_c0_g1_i1.p1  ORF type:complete len:466 (+),score=55.72 TRINITY_DN6228_c0_g1_i1:58-1455(+)